MANDRARKVALIILCINVTLLLLGMLVAWRSQRAAVARPTTPTNLARIAYGDPPCLDGSAGRDTHSTPRR